MNPVLWLIAGFIGWMLWRFLRDPRTSTIASNGKAYRVEPGPGQEDRAELLADIESRVQKVIERMGLPKKHVEFSENTDTTQHVAVTIDKKDIRLCLRHPDPNTLFFVAMHEVAHAYSTDVGHTKPFWDLYSLLIQTSVDMNLYKYKDYQEEPVKYCGMDISNSPFRT